MASDYQKPHGLTVILPDQAEDFLKQMDIFQVSWSRKKDGGTTSSNGYFYWS